MPKPTVCLITPPSSFLLDERVFMSLGILQVGAWLKQQGYVVHHLDLSGVVNYLDVVREYSGADVYGLTATSPQMPAAVKIAQVLDAKEKPHQTMLGGPHATLVNAAWKRERKYGVEGGRAAIEMAQLQMMFDTIIAGDGQLAVEHAIVLKARLVDADDVTSPMWLSNAGFESMPWPDRTLVDVASYKYAVDGERALSMISQLGCPFGCAFSLTGDARVYSNRGWESIESIVKRSTGVVSKCAHGGQTVDLVFNTPVANLKGNATCSTVVVEGRKEVFRVTAANGMDITGTAEHPILVAEDEQLKWKHIKDLKKNDWLVLRGNIAGPRDLVKLSKPSLKVIPPGGFDRRIVTTPTELNEDLAFLIGFIIGDGCLPKSQKKERIHLCVLPHQKENLKRIVREQFGMELVISTHSLTTKMENGWIYSAEVFAFLEQCCGIDPQDKLKVPACILASPTKVIQAFIDGLWSADGYTDSTGSYLTTISKKLADDVCLLLLQVGKFPYIFEGKSSGYSQGVYYRVNISPTCRVPLNRSIYKSPKSGLWYWRTKKSNRAGVRKKTLEKSGLEHELLSPNLFYSQVKSVVSTGVQPIYDLTVPGDENFVANGFVCHNCAGRDSSMLRRIRTRSSDNVVAELLHLYDVYGVRGCMFLDDELNVNKAIVELMQKIKAAGDSRGIEWRLRGFIKSELFTDEQAAAMYAAGFRQILVGFEAGHPRILENIQKRATVEDNTRCMAIAKRHGIKVKALMSIGHPGESYETTKALEEWLIAVEPSDFDVTIITPYPGSPYYDRATKLSTGGWSYTAANEDTLYMDDVDFNNDPKFYKGAPGDYRSYVATAQLNSFQLVAERDRIEDTVRKRLGIPFYATGSAINYEHSMGQTGIPAHILRGIQQ